MTDADLIARYLREKGATECPPCLSGPLKHYDIELGKRAKGKRGAMRSLLMGIQCNNAREKKRFERAAKLAKGK